MVFVLFCFPHKMQEGFKLFLLLWREYARKKKKKDSRDVYKTKRCSFLKDEPFWT